MALLETLTLTLGAALAKAVAKLWLKEQALAEAAAGGLIDTLKKGIDDFETRRAAQRLFEDMQLTVAKRLEALITREFRQLPEYDISAAVVAVSVVFDGLELSSALMRSDLDASMLREATQDAARQAFFTLGTDAKQVAELVLRESCAYAVTVAAKLPDFQVAATRELLKRTTELLDDVAQVLDRLDKLQSAAEPTLPAAERSFDTDYRRALVQKLDRLQLFGVRSVGAGAREWALSIAYVSLSSRRSGSAQAGDIQESLQQHTRLLVRGEAGAGKTTLVHWLAVRAAGRDFPEPLRDWNAMMPFYLRLRDYAGEQRVLPAPERLIESSLPNLVGSMPAGWAHKALRAGALLLVDGVDEFPAARREELLRWLRELLDMAPDNRVVLTSRPAAVDVDRGRGALRLLLETDLRFQSLSLEPMGVRQSDALISQWHEAVARDLPKEDTRLELEQFATALRRSLRDRPAVRNLATNPLLCAMICALN